MKHEPVIAKPVGEMSDDEFDAWMSSLPPAPGIGHVDDDDDDDAAALEDLAAGRVYPHELVAEWLKTWREDNDKPFKDWLAERNG